jgi:hypothetical protein
VVKELRLGRSATEARSGAANGSAEARDNATRGDVGGDGASLLTSGSAVEDALGGALSRACPALKLREASGTGSSAKGTAQGSLNIGETVLDTGGGLTAAGTFGSHGDSP